MEKTDTADIGRILLKLRDEIESTREALLSDNTEDRQRAIDKCSSFLLEESEKLVALQDGALGSSESFAQLPPVRLVDEDVVDLSHRVRSLLQRAETASGVDLTQREIEGSLAIMEKGEEGSKSKLPGSPRTIGSTIGESAIIQRAVGNCSTIPETDGSSLNNQKNALESSTIQSSSRTITQFGGDRRGHTHRTNIIKGMPNVQNLPVRNPAINQSNYENPEVVAQDVNRGILNLIDRGIVPHSANIEIVPSPIIHDQSLLHSSRQHIEALKERTQGQVGLTNGNPQYKFDNKARNNQSEKTVKIRNSAVTPVQHRPLPPPGTPAPNPFDHYGAVIETGQARYNNSVCEDHLGEESWKVARNEILPALEVLSSDYSIPIMLITQKALLEISEWSQLACPRKLTRGELLNCLENKIEVVQLMQSPGRLYTGPRREHFASLKITAMFKCRQERQKFLLYRRQQQAAGVIAISWIMHVRMKRCKQALVEKRREQLDNYHARIKQLKSDWPMKGQKVVIHLPSLGYPRKVRFTAQDLERRQMSQIMRLVDSTEPDTHVVYISSLPFTDDLQRYYTRLLGIKPALKTASPNNLEEDSLVSSRFTVIVPEAISKFPTHCLSLAQHLKYSSRAMNRLKSLIKGKRAIIVPGVTCLDTLSIADDLDVPVYGSEPEVCHLYSTKSGSRRIFNAANIELPPGDYDIYNIPQLTESLANLITNSPFVLQWLIKLDCQFDGRGTFVFQTENLSCIHEVRKECRKYGSQWKHKSFQHVSYLRILEQLPAALKTTKPANSLAHAAYSSWDIFQREICRQGGTIEALPPTNEITNITVDIEITPRDEVKILTCGDQIHSENFYCWGWSVPQTSIDPYLLETVVTKIGHAARARNVLGFVKLSFLTFMTEKNEQYLWATGMKLVYSDLVGLTKLLEFSTQSKLNAAEAIHEVEIESEERINREISLSGRTSGVAVTKRETMKKKVIQKHERYAVMSAQLLHTNLSVLHYTVFFQMCRAHAIGWDVRRKVGTLFTLLDTVKRENVGMICCGPSLQETIQNFARGLSVIHQEISAPNMQGITNFHAVLRDIDNVVQLMSENEETDCNEGNFRLSASLQRFSENEIEQE